MKSDYFNSIESRASYIQYRMFLFLKFGKFRALRNLQKLLVNSFVFRLKSVRDGLDFYNKSNLLVYGFAFTDFDKLLIALNLNSRFISPSFSNFLVSKKKFLSFFFETVDFYTLCLRVLYSNILFPLVESFSDRSTLLFRPYRDSHDVFYHLKSCFLKRIDSLWFLNGTFGLKLNFASWFAKNFPCDKFILKYFFSHTTFKDIILSDFSFSHFLIRFLLDGLV